MGSRKGLYSNFCLFSQRLSKLRFSTVCNTRIICSNQYHCLKKYDFLAPRQHACKIMSQALEIHKYNPETLPTVLKCDTAEFRNLFSKGLVTVKDLFAKNGFELRLCGGAVRDLLMGIKPKDLDFATTATPDQVVAVLEQNEIRIINMGGRDHGTVMCRLEEENFEITTLRIDVATDGRHAKIEYTTDWQLDALRRDLTINSLFMTLDGNIIDYFDGIKDIEKRFIRFVGQAEDRIQEDYLRILRYFRFYGRIADPMSKHDEDTLQIIAQNGDGLKGISGQRIWTELKLILGGKHPVKVFKMIHKCGLFPIIGLNQDPDFDKMQEIYQKTSHLDSDCMVLLAALFQDENDIVNLHNRVFLSNKEKSILSFIINHRSLVRPGINMTPEYIDWLVKGKRDLKQSRFFYHSFMEFLKYTGNVEAIQYFHSIDIPFFPVKGGDVKTICPNIKGKEIGETCRILYQKWKESGYHLTKQDLLEHLNEDTTLDILKEKFNET